MVKVITLNYLEWRVILLHNQPPLSSRSQNDIRNTNRTRYLGTLTEEQTNVSNTGSFLQFLMCMITFSLENILQLGELKFKKKVTR